MVIFRDSGENAAIFESRDHILDETELDAYAEQFGNDRALGYMEAMRDFNHALKSIVGLRIGEGGLPKSCPKIRKEVIDLFHTNDELIDKFVVKYTSKTFPAI